MFFKSFTLAAFIFLPINTLFSQEIILTDEKENYKLYENMIYYEDTTGKLNIDDIKKIDKAIFTRGTSKIPNLGMTKSSWWVYFKIKNNSTKQKWVLIFDNMYTDIWELYSSSSSGEKIFKTGGNSFPFSQREIENRKLNTFLPTEYGKSTEYYIKTKGQTDFSLPFYIQTEAWLYKENVSDENNYFLYFGIIATLVVFNLFIFFMLKDVTYLFYILATSAFALMATYHTGLSYQYFYSDHPWIQKNFDTIAALPYIGFGLPPFFRTRFRQHFSFQTTPD